MDQTTNNDVRATSAFLARLHKTLADPMYDGDLEFSDGESYLIREEAEYVARLRVNAASRALDEYLAALRNGIRLVRVVAQDKPMDRSDIRQFIREFSRKARLDWSFAEARVVRA